MVRLGIRLRDFGRTFGWDGLATFTRHLPPDSATARAFNPRFDGWSRIEMQVADLFDELERIRFAIEAKMAKSRPRSPVRYPRPWEDDNQHIGSGAIPVSEFWDWWAGD